MFRGLELFSEFTQRGSRGDPKGCFRGKPFYGGEYSLGGKEEKSRPIKQPFGPLIS